MTRDEAKAMLNLWHQMQGDLAALFRLDKHSVLTDGQNQRMQQLEQAADELHERIIAAMTGSNQ